MGLSKYPHSRGRVYVVCRSSQHVGAVQTCWKQTPITPTAEKPSHGIPHGDPLRFQTVVMVHVQIVPTRAAADGASAALLFQNSSHIFGCQAVGLSNVA